MPELTLAPDHGERRPLHLAALAELDRRIAEAAERAAARESADRSPPARSAARRTPDALAACAEALAVLDVVPSAAEAGRRGRLVPARVTDGADFLITAGRHPVVEAALAGTAAAFVPNDCDLSPGRRVLLLTGPNMAGKSTFLRQNALFVVLAQAGLPVPAEARADRRGGPAVLPRRAPPTTWPAGAPPSWSR